MEAKDQLVGVWTRMVEDRGGRVSVDDGVCHLWADSAFPFWNTLTLTGESISAGDLGDQLARTATFMRGRSRPGLLWLFEDLLDPAAKAAFPRLMSDAGLEISFTGWGMAGDVEVPDPSSSSPELEFRRVETEDELLTYGEINARAYGMAEDAGPAALSGSKAWLRDTYAYIAYDRGRPVACAATVENDDALFLALVATMPADMRRGFGEAVTRKAIHEGIRRTGQQHVVLHATPAGRPVYERIGYRTNSAVHFIQLASQ
ncbi:GNAT family N-acetyltransferase [Actinoplanes sp. TBRC 11911]|uniref:GNAT family N-acetyltransferase n=1 Tax=Actinoplanes sp. TBRC 11911 TaxID=2729386 RepID=UPI001B7D6EC6|nr:GNAT family N-acetyltransferase [Actinoplanes sp. TBRC 11911]